MGSILSKTPAMMADFLLFETLVAALLVCIALGIVKLGRIKGPANRYVVWFITLIAIAILPAFWLHGPKLNLAVLPAPSHPLESPALQADIHSGAAHAPQRPLEPLASNPSAASIPAYNGQPVSSPVNPDGNFYWLHAFKTLIAWAWFTGFLFMLTRLFVGWHRLTCMLHSAEPLTGRLHFKNRYAGRINIMLSSQVLCPMCFGFLRPMILLPKQMIGASSPRDLKMVLRHELAHIERKDSWVNLFQRIVEAALFFHPLVWYASSQLTHQREQLCDNHVIRAGSSPAKYVELLLRIVEQGIEKTSYQALALFEGRLLSRIQRLLEPAASNAVKATRRALVVAAMTVVGCLAICSIRLEARPVPDNPAMQLEDIQGMSAPGLEPAATCSISGKILGEIGQPYSSSLFVVQAWAESDEPEGSLGRYQIQQQTTTFSDGSYQLNGLDGRPVYVMVVEHRYDEDGQPWPPCYYPGTVSRDQAVKIAFDGDSSIEDIDIKLVSKGDTVLEGRVLDENTGKPVPDALVTVHHADMLFDQVTTYTDAQGYYRMDCLGSGAFLVHIDAKPWGYVRTRRAVDLNTEQTTRADFALRPAATISGIFVGEDGGPMEISENAFGFSYPSHLTNSAETSRISWTGLGNKHSEKGQPSHQYHISFQDGQGDYEDDIMVFPTRDSFMIEAVLPGKTQLQFQPREEGLAVKRILYRGENVMDTGLEIGPGDHIEDVAIIVGRS